MHAHNHRVTDQAELCLVSQDEIFPNLLHRPSLGDMPEHGIVDLYARRMGALREAQVAEHQVELDHMVVTKPFGRPFTAQPSFPPDPAAGDAEIASGLARLRHRLAAAATPNRKLATS